MQKLKIIVGGFIGILPAGGVTWDYVQYPVGFSMLGHDVYYIEDTRLYPVYQKAGSSWDDCSAAVAHVKNVMDYFGMKHKWAYRDEASGQCFGLSVAEIKNICTTADVFVNISCSTFLRDEYLKIPVRILIDSDPMFTQIQYDSTQMFTPGEPGGMKAMIDAHNYLFTFGENIGATDCRIPVAGLTWHTTRQPVCLNYWKPGEHVSSLSAPFTTLMNWTAGKQLQYNGEAWGQKDIEFKKVLSLPHLVSDINFSAIVNQTGGTTKAFNKEDIENSGWKILDAAIHAGTWQSYQQFIGGSLGEFSVAKETYVKANTGWFSCRSACYLAAGKPVVTQDTRWSKFLPTGLGLFAFTDLKTAKNAVEEVLANYKIHALHAREIAEEYFDSNKVLGRLLSKVG